MRVTKFVHSCLLVEHADKAVLIDPGEYSWPIIDLHALPRLDAVLVTHAHRDHFDLEALRQISRHSPDTLLISNREVVALAARGDIVMTSKLPDWLSMQTSKHPAVHWRDDQVMNSTFHLFDLLTDAGDTQTIKESREILALPITAPWGSLQSALDAALAVKPKVVLPLHDWHWHEAARQDAYGKAQQVLAAHSIRFIPLETGVSIDLDS